MQKVLIGLISTIVGFQLSAYEWMVVDGFAAFGTADAPLATGSVIVPADQTVQTVSTVLRDNGTLTLTGSDSLSIADGGSALVAGGSLVFDVPIASSGKMALGVVPILTVWDGNYLPKDWTLILAGKTFDDVTVESAVLDGGYVYPHFLSAGAYNLKATGANSYTVQFQGKQSNAIKGTVVEFKCESDGIYARGVDAYSAGNVVPGSIDLETDGTKQTYATSGATPAYGVYSITFRHADDSAKAISFRKAFAQAGALNASGVKVMFGPCAESVESVFSVANTGWLGADLHVCDKATLKVSNKDGLPGSGKVTVEDGGVLNLATGKGMSEGVSSGGCAIEVCAGGKLGLTGWWTLGTQPGRSVDLTLNGGSLVLSGDQTYLDWVTFRDGGYTSTGWVRTGLVDCTWKVGGISPSTNNANLKLVSRYDGTKTVSDIYSWTLDVADVTGDEAADFEFRGNIQDLGADYTGTKVIKRGAGTVRFAGANTCSGGNVSVCGGTVMLANDAAFNASQPVVLSAGALAVEAGKSIAMNTLEVGLGGGKIVVASGATLSFADSASVSWATNIRSNRLNITLADETARVRFGTSSAGLSASQLAQIRVDACPAQIDENGYVRKGPAPGFQLLLR